METVQPARLAEALLTRRGRMLVLVLVATLSLGLAGPAQAGLGELIEDAGEELPVVGGIVDPVVEVIADPVADVVEPVLEVMAPVVEHVVDPVVEEVAPVVEDVVDPVVDEDVPPVAEKVVLAPIESVAASGPSLAGNTDQVLIDGDDHGSLILAQALQAALAGTAGTPPAVTGTLADSTGVGWLMGLTAWLRSAANALADLVSIPLRLLEILARALLTAGSGLVAPASLALAFTIYAVGDRRWERLRASALN